MSNHTFEQKCVEWYQSLFSAVIDAHGNPEHIIDLMSPQLRETLIRNNIHLVYIGEDK